MKERETNVWDCMIYVAGAICFAFVVWVIFG